MPRVAPATQLQRVIAHCNAHETIGPRDMQAITGYSRNRAGNILTRLRRTGWIERAERGVYRLSSKARLWHGPVGEQIVRFCNEGATSAQFVAWKLGISLGSAGSWLQTLCKQKRIRRVSYGVYASLREESVDVRVTSEASAAG